MSRAPVATALAIVVAQLPTQASGVAAGWALQDAPVHAEPAGEEAVARECGELRVAGHHRAIERRARGRAQAQCIAGDATAGVDGDAAGGRVAVVHPEAAGAGIEVAADRQRRRRDGAQPGDQAERDLEPRGRASSA